MNLLNPQSTDFAGKATFAAMARRVANDPPKPEFPNRLRAVRQRRGLSLAKVAEQARKPLSSIQRYETGKYQLNVQDAEVLARVLQVDVMEILPGPDSRMVPVVGYIGAGAQVYPIDDHAKGAGLDEAPCPPNLVPDDTIAVLVRGDSMPPLSDGWTLFYSRKHERGPVDLVGHLCAVKVANDGPLLVKQLRRGPDKGRYNLVSANAPLIENAELDWASRITGMLPPDLP